VRRFLFDTSVFVYALGGEHPYRDPCRAIMSAGEQGLLAGEASVDLIHEFAYVRLRKGISRHAAAADARDIAGTSRLHVVEPSDIERALDLWCEHKRLDMRDAIFAAQALNRGIDAILSADQGFDGIPGLERIDPADTAAVASLIAR
jgi:predicted nucleic acid-binding protein